MISHDLTAYLKAQFALDWTGIHGAPHWARVRAIGLRLAPMTGANTRVVEYFAFLHDARRLDDGWDPGHGRRAVALAWKLRGTLVELAPNELELLVEALEHHSSGRVAADVTVQTCWDADRLDLGRVGVRPDPRYLCTTAAKDPIFIEWAFRRSIAWRSDRRALQA